MTDLSYIEISVKIKRGEIINQFNEIYELIFINNLPTLFKKLSSYKQDGVIVSQGDIDKSTGKNRKGLHSMLGVYNVYDFEI